MPKLLNIKKEVRMRRILLFVIILVSLSIFVDAALPPPPPAPGGFGDTGTNTVDTTDSSFNQPISDPVVEQYEQELYDSPVTSSLGGLVGQAIDIPEITNSIIKEIQKSLPDTSQIESDVKNLKIVLTSTLTLSVINFILLIIILIFVIKNKSIKTSSTPIKSSVNPALKSYVDQMLAKGYTKESIKTELIKNGYHKDSIEAVL